VVKIALTPDQIKALLAKPQRKPKQDKGIDTSVRDYRTWFRLAQHSLDRETGEHAVCDNPDCIDPRPALTSPYGEIRVQFVAEVSGRKMCRYCFLDGWLLEDPNQIGLGI
jgi:hypothetical protein